MSRRSRIALAAAAISALLIAAAPAQAGSPQATSSTDHLATYLTKKKLKPKKRISYFVLCGAPATSSCQLTVRSKLKVKGFKFPALVSSAAFPGGTVAEAFIKPSKSIRRAIRRFPKRARLVTKVTSVDLATGETDVDKRTYRFKR